MKSKKIIAIIVACVLITSIVCFGSGYSVYVAQKDVKHAEAELLEAQENYQLEVYKSTKLQSELKKTKKELKTANEELDVANMTIADLKEQEYKLVYLGDFKITHYCDQRYDHICGGNGVTASGAKTEVGTTVAVDPSVIPYGTTIYIEGYGYRIAQDCGSAVNNNQIDVLVGTHDQALSMGTTSAGVWVLL
jgi:3D (Asp-Asp-Asp) domain-containing protein